MNKLHAKAQKRSEYYGRYNIEKNSLLFGEGGKLSTEKSTCKLNEMDKSYLDFVFAIPLRAVESDLRVLYWVNQNMRSK